MLAGSILDAKGDVWIMVEKNPLQKVSHKDTIHFYGSDSTRNGGYALTPMPWTGPAPRTRTGRGCKIPSPPTCVVQGRPTVCASNRRSPMCFAFSTHWLPSALAFGPSSRCFWTGWECCCEDLPQGHWLIYGRRCFVKFRSHP